MIKRGEIRIGIFIFLVSISIIIFQIQISSAENINFVKNNNITKFLETNFKNIVKYDLRILDEFKTNQTKVNVIVRLKDKSSIVLDGTKEERRELLRQKDEWFQPIIHNVLAILNEDEIEVTHKFSDGFGGNLIKEGFYKLINDIRIEAIYKDEIAHGILSQSAPLINATNVWNDLNFTGKGVKVCVVDSGVNKSHADLSGKIVGEYCYCSASDSLLGSNDCCLDGTAEDSKAEDYHGHGTHVTGIIASQDPIYRGIAFNASIYHVKVLNSSNDGTFADIANAINWCRVNASANIISISIGDKQNHPGMSICPITIDIEINNAYNSNISLLTLLMRMGLPMCELEGNVNEK